MRTQRDESQRTLGPRVRAPWVLWEPLDETGPGWTRPTGWHDSAMPEAARARVSRWNHGVARLNATLRDARGQRASRQMIERCRRRQRQAQRLMRGLVARAVRPQHPVAVACRMGVNPQSRDDRRGASFFRVISV